MHFLQNYYQQCLEENILDNNLTYDTTITDNNTDDTIEYSIFKVAIANQCLMHETQNNIICSLQYYRQNYSPLNIGHIAEDSYFKQDCTNSMKNPSQKFVVNEINSLSGK